MKSKPIDCKWSYSCNCNESKSIYCASCRFYFPVDSIFGYCKALPEFVLVPWCRDVCSFYQEVK